MAPQLDTVDIASPDQLIPRVKNGRLYGRGACDTKGSVAAMFTAVCELARSRQRPAETEIIFAGLVDEETSQCGSRTLANSGLKADLAIVGEPTRLQVVTAHKGNLWLKLETHGLAAHGSRPELGRNAVHEMARIVNLLETDYAAQLRQRRHPLLRHATINVGTIAGGVQANIVPAHCSITIDRRTLPGEKDTSVWREIQRILRRHRLRASLTNTKAASCLATLETNPRLPLVRQFLRTVGQRGTVGVDYFCDASILAHGGIPSIVFGPGDIAQAHLPRTSGFRSFRLNVPALYWSISSSRFRDLPSEPSIPLMPPAETIESPQLSEASHQSSFFRQGGWMMIASVASGVLMFAVQIFSKKFLVDSEYSAFGVLVQITNWIAIPALGLQMVFAQQTAAAITGHHESELAATVRSVMLWTFCVWVVTTIVAIICRDQWIAAFKLSNPIALWLTLAAGLVMVWLQLFQGLLQGRQNFLWFGWSYIFNGFGRVLIGGVIVIALHGQVPPG